MTAKTNAETTTVNIHDAKTQLSRLIAVVEQGQEVTIARAGKPVARLVPVAPDRKPGSMKGRVTLPDSFFDPLPEDELAAWQQ